MILPAIEDKVILKPDSDKHFIPNVDYGEFWHVFYSFLRKNFDFHKPVVGMENKINPYFGNFGFCYQVVNKTPKYFNLGVDISARPRTSVNCIYNGLLEYSGFGHINGKYVFLSHPDIKTEDGFVMHSLYMHLRSFNVQFNSYQKMLRRISLNKYPNVEIKKGFKIGEVGSTGNANGLNSFLHFQIEFRNESGKIIVVDPAEVFGFEHKENLTKDITSEKDFKELANGRVKELKELSIDKYWKA